MDKPQRSAPGVPPGFAEPQPASQPSWQPSYNTTTGWTNWNGWQPQGHVSEFRVDTRNWKAANLDLDARLEGFDAWQNRALVHLSGNRLDVRRLLEWAEKHFGRIDSAAERRGAQETGLVDDVAAVSFALHNGLSFLVSDALSLEGRTCSASGLEFWRRIAARWHGNAPQVLTAKVKKFSYPIRCANLTQLCERLPQWEQTGNELAQCGIPVHPLMQAQALDHLVTDALLQTIVGRPDLADYGPKLAFVKAQSRHGQQKSLPTLHPSSDIASV